LTLYACSKAGYTNLLLYQTLVTEVGKKMSLLPAMNLSNVFWALANAYGELTPLHFEPQFFLDTEEYIKSNVNQFNQQELANLMWSFARFSSENVAGEHQKAPSEQTERSRVVETDWSKRNLDVIRRISERVCARLSEPGVLSMLIPQSVAMCAWAVAKLGLTNCDGFKSALEAKAIRLLGDPISHQPNADAERTLNAQSLSQLIWGCTNLGLLSNNEELNSPQIMHRCLEEIKNWDKRSQPFFPAVIHALGKREHPLSEEISSVLGDLLKGPEAIILTEESIFSLLEVLAFQGHREIVRHAFENLLNLKSPLANTKEIISLLVSTGIYTDDILTNFCSSSFAGDSLLSKCAKKFAKSWQVSTQPSLTDFHNLVSGNHDPERHAKTKESRLLGHLLTRASFGNIPSILHEFSWFARNRHWVKIAGDTKADLLAKVITANQPKTAVEFGSYCGYSGLVISNLLPDNGASLVTVEADPTNYLITNTIFRFAGLPNTRAKCLIGWSNRRISGLGYGLKKPVDFVFMDHRGAFYRRDLELMTNAGWFRQGSVVVADNCLNPGAPDYLYDMIWNPNWKSEIVVLNEAFTTVPDAMCVSIYNPKQEFESRPMPKDISDLAKECDIFALASQRRTFLWSAWEEHAKKVQRVLQHFKVL